MFLHDPSNVFHLLFNMLLLWQLGPHVEIALGAKRFVLLYFGAGLSGSLLYSAWALLFSDPSIPVIGASGAVLGVIAGFSFLFPEARLLLWFFQPMKGKHLLYLVVALDLIFFLSDRNIAIQAHFGGMLFAYLYIARPWGTRLSRHFRWHSH
jgi:membrane associated rhomboid family serine protease